MEKTSMLSVGVTIVPNLAISHTENDDTRPTKLSIPWTAGMKLHDLLSRVRSRCDISKNLYLHEKDELLRCTVPVDDTSRVIRMKNLELDDPRIYDGCTVALPPQDFNADGRETVEELFLVVALPDWRKKLNLEDHLLRCSLNFSHIYCGITLVKIPAIESIRVVDSATSKVMTFRFRRPMEPFGRGLERSCDTELRSHVVKDVMQSIGRSFKKQLKFHVTLSSACDNTENDGANVFIFSESDPLGDMSILDLNLKGPVLNAKLSTEYRAEITVRQRTGSFQLTSGSSSSVKDVMVAVYHQMGFPVSSQRIILAWEPLDPMKKLSHYEIEQGDELFVLLEQCGGMYHPSSARVDNLDLEDVSVNVKVLLPTGHFQWIRVQEGMLASEVKQIVLKLYKGFNGSGESDSDKECASRDEEESGQGLENALEVQQQKINRLRNELREAELEAKQTKKKLKKCHTSESIPQGDCNANAKGSFGR